MFPALSKAWWLLALCGILDAACAAMNLLTLNPEGTPELRRFASPGMVWDMSLLALVAGACAVAAGVWSGGRGRSWLLSLHGAALGAFGLIGVSPLVRGPLSFRPISLLFLVMAVSLGAFALETARTQRDSAVNRWCLRAIGEASIGFACSFIAVGFGWVRLAPPHSYWIWMSSYFGLCAMFMIYLALLVRGERVAGSGQALPRIGSPRPAHSR